MNDTRDEDSRADAERVKSRQKCRHLTIAVQEALQKMKTSYEQKNDERAMIYAYLALGRLEYLAELMVHQNEEAAQRNEVASGTNSPASGENRSAGCGNADPPFWFLPGTGRDQR